jgi:hypothetical protein
VHYFTVRFCVVPRGFFGNSPGTVASLFSICATTMCAILFLYDIGSYDASN